MSVVETIADMTEIDELTAKRLLDEFNNGLAEICKSSFHFKHLYLLLNLPKRPIREQRFLCILMGLKMEHNYIMGVLRELHSPQEAK